jgi:hypothetical protein
MQNLSNTKLVQITFQQKKYNQKNLQIFSWVNTELA